LGSGAIGVQLGSCYVINVNKDMTSCSILNQSLSLVYASLRDFLLGGDCETWAEMDSQGDDLFASSAECHFLIFQDFEFADGLFR